jgi:hypothetical protein
MAATLAGKRNIPGMRLKAPMLARELGCSGVQFLCDDILNNL